MQLIQRGTTLLGRLLLYVFCSSIGTETQIGSLVPLSFCVASQILCHHSWSTIEFFKMRF
jgi:hypothetical protein